MTNNKSIILSKNNKITKGLLDNINIGDKLENTNDFSKRLVLVTDAIENMFNMLKGEKILSYDEFRKKYSKVRHRRFKRIKRYKSIWK